jgi:RNA polymerase sigma factor (sigma-70 family)
MTPERRDITSQWMDPTQLGEDYVLQFKIKNGPLLRAIRIRFTTIKGFCEASGINQSIVYKYLALRLAPISKTGKWKPSALKMGRCLRLPPDCLFPEIHLQNVLARSSGELDVSREEIELMIEQQGAPSPEAILINDEVQRTLSGLLNELTPRQERVIRRRFGFDKEPATLEEIAREFDLSRDRVRQIEAKAIRKLRHVSRIRKLQNAGVEMEIDDDRPPPPPPPPPPPIELNVPLGPPPPLSPLLDGFLTTLSVRISVAEQIAKGKPLVEVMAKMGIPVEYHNRKAMYDALRTMALRVLTHINASHQLIEELKGMTLSSLLRLAKITGWPADEPEEIAP